MVLTLVEREGNPDNAALQHKGGNKISQGRPARQGLNDVNEWTGLSLGGHVASRKREVMLPPTQ